MNGKNELIIFRRYSLEAVLKYLFLQYSIAFEEFFLEVDRMKIIRKINNSAAVALDSLGNEIIVLGKGLGFPEVPYELYDLSKIERTFYDINSKYYSLISQIPQPILMATAEIAELAEEMLQTQLNPNFPITLADHINFANERIKNGFDLTSAIAYDIQHLYKKEYEISKKALQIIKKITGLSLPENEAIYIALNLINAESSDNDMHQTMRDARIITDVKRMIEKNLDIIIDTESYNYSRFVTHLRYLIQRLSMDSDIEIKDKIMLGTLVMQYPEIYNCANQISEYFKDRWNWKCINDELLYLMLHIKRLQDK